MKVVSSRFMHHLLYIASSCGFPNVDGYGKRRRLALCDQDDFTALKSIRCQKTIWMLAGRGCSLPLGKSLSSFSKHDFQGRVWCLASGWGEWGGGREQCSPEQPVSLLWQVIKFEMPTHCTLGTGVEKKSRNSQTLFLQVSWHHGDKYRPC